MKRDANKTTRPAGALYIWMLYVIAVTCGAALMALEILGGRLLSPFFGASVYVWGSIISIFLIALSSGYYVGGIVADRKPSVAYLAAFIAIAGLLTLIIPPLAPVFSRYFFSLGLGNYAVLVVSMLLFCLPSIGLGMVSPYVVKLGVGETDRLGNTVGKFYAVSTFGSIFGTLATTFVLIPLFGVKELIFTLGVILVSLAGLVFIGSRLWMRAGAVFALMAVVLAVSMTSPTLALSMQNLEMVYTHESMYNDIFVGDYGDTRYLMFTEKLLQSGMNKRDPNAHIFNYTHLIDEASAYYKPEAKDILLIGLGGGSIPKALHVGREDISFDAVEIDPAVIRVAYDYFDMPKLPNFRTFAMDGRMFLQGAEREYDVAILDAYNSLFIPHHLTTEEFFDELAAVVRPEGIVLINVISNPDGNYSKFFKSLLRTAQTGFSEWRLFLAEEANPDGLNNLVLVLSRKALDSPGQIAGYPEYLSPIDLSNSLVLTDNYAPVELLAADLMSQL